ncbi:MAG: EAL domain-containing protein [Paracoccaceae bacterium]
MPHPAASVLGRLRWAPGTTGARPPALALVPGLTLGAFWLGGEPALLATAVLLPSLAALAVAAGPQAAPARDRVTGLPSRRAIVDALDRALAHGGERHMLPACLVLELEGLHEIERRHGHAASDGALALVAGRLSDELRGSDVLARLGATRLGLALGPGRRADLAALLQIAGRLQDAVAEPVGKVGAAAVLSCSVGVCLPARSPAPGGAAMLEAAEAALCEAIQHGPGALRAFSRDMQVAARLRRALADEAAEALESGQIRPWFQPQTSTDTGAVSGFEALARWSHPEHGLIPPAEFVPRIAQAGLSQKLSDVMLVHALAALRSWDRDGLRIPAVGLNFSPAELRAPGLADRVARALDRFALGPERLTIEVLESTLSGTGDEMAARNITALAELGCGIDLDHFGTGRASLAAIRRFAVRRLKIDRAYVACVDRDREQQDMVAAILMMCDRLGLGTLATGVERSGEHSILAQLGCGHVQGHGIGRPIPFEDTPAWIRRHNAKLGGAPLPGMASGMAPGNKAKTA